MARPADGPPRLLVGVLTLALIVGLQLAAPVAQAAGGSISGTVFDAVTLAPIQDACVKIFEPPASGPETALTTTDELGDYTFPDLPPGNYLVNFVDSLPGCGSATGYAAEWWPGGRFPNDADPVTVTEGQSSEADAALERSGSISGTVTDEAEPPAPVLGACVKVFLPPDGSPGMATGPQLTQLETDATGAYTASDLFPGDFLVSFSGASPGCGTATGYVQEWYDDKPSPNQADPVPVAPEQTTTVDAALASGGFISGTVADEGEPPVGIPGICVQAFNVSAGNQFGPGPSIGMTQTGGNGDYTLGPLPPDTDYRLQFMDGQGCFSGPNQYVSEWWNDKTSFQDTGPGDDVAVTAGNTTTGKDAALSAGGFISGHVQRSDDSVAIPSICVQAFDAGAADPQFGPGPPFGMAQTDASGDYTLGPLPPNPSYRVEFRDGMGCPGGPNQYVGEWWNEKATFQATGPGDDVAVTAGSTTSGINGTLTPGGFISGTVTDDVPDPQPIEGICVQASDVSEGGGFGPGPPEAFTPTGPEGTYTLGPLPEDTDYRVEFRDGMGCPGGPGQYVSEWWNNKPTFQDTGPGDDVAVTAGNTTAGKDAALATGGFISGTVTDSGTTDPIQSICVQAFDASAGDPEFGPGPPFGMAQTDASGDYMLGPLPGDDYLVQFLDGPGCFSGPQEYVGEWWQDAAQFQDATAVNVSAPSITPGIDAALAAGGFISGTVTDSDTTDPIPGICVNASSAGEADPDFGPGPQKGFAQSGADGGYNLGPLPPDTYLVEFRDGMGCFGGPGQYVGEWWQDAAMFQDATGEVVTAGNTTPGIDGTLQLGGLISGTVSDAVTSDPIPGICLNVYDASEVGPDGPEQNLGFSQTDENGDYTVGPIPPGTDYRVQFVDEVWCEGGPHLYLSEWWMEAASFDGSIDIVVTAGNTTPGIDGTLELGGLISGTVSDAVTSAPVPGICLNVYDASEVGPDGPEENVGFAQTDQNGEYTLGPIPPGTDYRVQFIDATWCDGGPHQYLSEWWNNKPSFQDTGPGDDVAVTAGNITPGIDGTLEKGGTISGTVTGSDTLGPLQGICINAYDASGAGPDGNDENVGFAQTDENGSYTLGPLAAGAAYHVQFIDEDWCDGAPNQYLGEWWDDKPSFEAANPVDVTVGDDTSSIDAELLGGPGTADLELDKWAPEFAVAGSKIVYQLDVFNHGPFAANGVVVTDTLPPGATFDAGNSNLSCAPGDPGEIACEFLGILQKESSVGFGIAVDLDESLLDGTILDNVAVASHDGPDNDVNNEASASTTIVPDDSADVLVRKFGDPVGAVGAAYRYFIEVDNAGPATATNVQVTDDIPTGMAYVDDPDDSCTEFLGIVTCDFGDIPAGEPEARFAVITVVPEATISDTTVSNIAAVTSDSPDPNAANNDSEEVSTDIHPQGAYDLSVRKTVGPFEEDMTLGVGQPFTWYIRVDNNGPSAVGDVTLTDALPDGIESITASPACAPDPPVAGQSLVCDLGTLEPGDSRLVTVTATPTTVGELTNTATVTAAAGDIDTENNTAINEGMVQPGGSADVSIEKVASSEPASKDKAFRYILRAHNFGPSIAMDVVVTDELPPGLTPSSPGCTFLGDVATCELGDILPGETRSAEITVTSTATGVLANSASVASDPGSPDPNPGNDATGITTQVNDAAFTGSPEVSSGGTQSEQPTGEVDITMVGGDVSPITVTVAPDCPGDVDWVSLSLGSATVPMTDNGDGTWTGTIPANQVQTGDLIVTVKCAAEPPAENDIGQVQLYDPSGQITDAVTGDPVSGATVTLFKVQGWSAKAAPGDGTPNTCQSNASKAAGDPWDDPLTAEMEAVDIQADPASGEIDPAANPLVTDVNGRYAWNVAAGCWYVVVSRAGYQTLTSPVVGVPPEVTDLDLELTPLARPDGLIKLGSRTVGNDIYNTTAADQTIATDIKKKKSETFTITVQNDGNVADAFTLQGTSTGSGLSVAYLSSGANITSQVLAGTFNIGTLDPGASKTIKLVMTAGRSEGEMTSALLTVTSVGAPSSKDAVQAIATVGK